MAKVKITAETLTDEQILQAFKFGLVSETLYLTAIGASGAETEDDDGMLCDPDENEIERAREICAHAINARAKETP